ncbi:MAG: hypothetical protein IPL32_02740 [Chloracidobacterium sp.]|nr:hypothetical protein [Chloracidobacterium sp.]
MKRRLIYAALLVSLILGVINGQEMSDGEIIVTPAEKREVQAFAKQFVKRLQQTHDMTPLIREFFVRDFASCLRREIEKDAENGEGKKLQLSSRELVRAYSTEMNLHYMMIVAFMYDNGRGIKGDYDPFKSTFPPRIQKQLDALERDGQLLDNDQLLDQKSYFRMLRRMEKVITEALQYITRKKIESTPAFLKEFNRYAKSDWLGYVVKAGPGDHALVCKHPGAKVYSVTTPTWLVLALMKEKGKLRISFAGPYGE